MALALGSVVNAEPESAGWLLISSIYVASSPANSLAPNESVQCSLPMWFINHSILSDSFSASEFAGPLATYIELIGDHPALSGSALTTEPNADAVGATSMA